MRQKIKSIDELRELSWKKDFDCFILLNFSLISKKTIRYIPKKRKFKVYHHIDDTENTYTDVQLKKSNIGLAMKKGALINDE